MPINPTSRRKFLKKAALTSGLSTLGIIAAKGESGAAKNSTKKLPWEVWVAGIYQEEIFTDTAEQMLERILSEMAQIRARSGFSMGI